MNVTSPAVKLDLQKRLRRIEGQVRGVQRMIEEERDCGELIQQLAAIRSAVQQASLVLVRSYAAQCLRADAPPDDREAMIESLIGVLNKVP